jgi:hypothetical protein
VRHDFEYLPALAFRRALGKSRPATLEGGKGSAPSAPDPYTVAGATTQSNDTTAAYNKALNLNNYSNPFGSQTSSIVGTDPSTGAPIYQTTIGASQPLQNLINGAETQAGTSNTTLNNSLYGLGGVNQQLSQIGSQLNPNSAQQAMQQGDQAAYAAQTQYLNPQFQQEGASLQSQLANEGLSPGSQAYTNSMTNFNNAQQQAYSNAANEATLTGSQIGSQMLQNQLGVAGEQGNLLGQQATNLGQQASLSQLPYQDLSSLAGLVPGNTGTATSSAQPANIAQAFQNQYQGQLNSYDANVQSANSTESGLFGLGTAGMLALALSDRRAKTDIEAIAPFADGVNFYRYRYLSDAPGTVRYGFMADEVRRSKPDAVVRLPNGLDAVNYDRAFGA